MNKALYLGGFEMPDGNAAAQRVVGIAKILDVLGYKVHFAGLSRKIEAPESGLIDNFSYTNYSYPHSTIAWLKYLSGYDYSINEIKKQNPNLVILYNHPALAIEKIARFCHENGIKIIADVTEWYEAHGNPVFRYIKSYDINRRMYRSHLKVDGLICISSYLANYYDQLGIKNVEIPALVDLEQEKWHRNVESHQDEIRFIYAGSPGHFKDRLDLILYAFDEVLSKLNKNVRFDIVGITKEQYEQTWNDKTVRSYVNFNGRRPHKEVIKKLLEADFQIFLRPDTLPNRAGFPTKFTETISSGTLPVTNLSSNLEQYLTDGQNGFVIKGLELSSIATTIEHALSLDSEEINKMKKNIDKQTFDYRRYIGILDELVKSL